MSTFTITTLGCKVNQAESVTIARDLAGSDWTLAEGCEQADVCIVNTCTVTQKASMQSRQAVRQAIRANPHARIMVTGCYAQTAPEEIKKIKGVNRIIDQAEKFNLRDIICHETDSNPVRPDIHSSANQIEHQFNYIPDRSLSNRTRPFLKIQDGCDAFCTYCIVPYARGRSRSMTPEAVLENINQIAKEGYHELVLTGIHLGNYGRDLRPGTSLLTLLNRIRTSTVIDRIRLSSIEPLELTEDIVKCVADSKRFCRHFHIPLQSGDDEILKRMHRPYTQAAFRKLVLTIKKQIPEAAIGVDTLIGFPGETDTAFNNTYRLIQDLPVTYLHVFPFSPRPGTPASTFSGQLEPQKIKDRCRRMRKLGHEKRKNFHRSFIDNKVQVLIESRRDRPTGLLKGISSNYLPVLAEGRDSWKNTFVDVTIKAINNNQLMGTIDC